MEQPNTLDTKALDCFPGRVVRKDLVSIFKGAGGAAGRRAAADVAGRKGLAPHRA
ncbi:MAG: BREX system Lon protease-like protein BrxL [Anaerolineae bacterium]|nr:BREX system Lon protease-like protein BrxL [Anaerolineae bacterium]